MTLRQVGAASQEERIGNSKNVICVFTFQLFVLHTQKYFSFFVPSGNVEHGLARGKEAVGLDTSDGTSWSLLGNAYLSHFFQVVSLFLHIICNL